MVKLVKITGLPNDTDDKSLSDAQPQPDPSLAAEGWQRRFTADAQRVKEVLELYASLGYEVRAEPVRAGDVHDDCDDCQASANLSLSTIYTRKK